MKPNTALRKLLREHFRLARGLFPEWSNRVCYRWATQVSQLKFDGNHLLQGRPWSLRPQVLTGGK